MTKEYYRPDEVAEMLKISIRTIYSLINDINDPLPTTRIRRQLRVPRREFEEWLKRRDNKPWE